MGSEKKILTEIKHDAEAAARTVGHDAGAAAAQVKNDAKAAAGEVSKDASAAAGEVGRSASAGLDHAARTASEVAGSAKGDVDRLAETARSGAASLGHDARAGLKEVAREARHVADDQKNLLANQMDGVVDALDKVAGELDDSKAPFAGYVHAAADKARGVSAAVHDRSVDEILSQAEDFGRRQPLLFVGAAALAGFAASRFLRASAARARTDRT
jgi:hypothetical protein